jgi:hypothetical protein
MMRGVTIALVAGLAGLAIAIGVALAQSPMSVAATNRRAGAVEAPLTSTDRGATYCQSGEALPRGTSAIRLWLDATTGPRVRVVASAAGGVLSSGERGSGWTGGSVTVAVAPLPRTVRGVTVCASFQLHDETLVVQGAAASTASATRASGTPLAGRMWIEYLRPGARSWASQLGAVVDRMGLGRAAAGSWIVFLALALFAAAATLASRLVVRELR